MPIIAPFEQMAMGKGRVEGIQIGEQRGSLQEAQEILLDLLNDRFGELPASLRKRIQALRIIHS